MRFLAHALLFFSLSVRAGEADFEKARRVASQLERHQAQVDVSEKNQREILAKLFEINRRIKKVSREKSNLSGVKQNLETSIQDLQEQIVDLQKDLQTQGRELNQHVRWISQTKDFAWLNLFSGSRGPAQADLNLYILGRLTEREKNRIQDYFAERRQLQKNQDKVRARLEKLNRVSQDLAQKETDFLGEQQIRKKALDQIRSQKSKILAKIRSLKNTELAQKLEDTGLLDGLVRASFGDAKGRLPLPAAGQLQQRFGIVKARETSYYKNHKGIFIHAKSAQEIKSVFEGKVAFAGAVDGFGNTLVVDHGDHYYTVYSSLAELQVHEGESVQRQQVLAQAGVSHFYQDAGVYFEVRHFSEPQDPLEWLKKGSL